MEVQLFSISSIWKLLNLVSRWKMPRSLGSALIGLPCYFIWGNNALIGSLFFISLFLISPVNRFVLDLTIKENHAHIKYLRIFLFSANKVVPVSNIKLVYNAGTVDSLFVFQIKLKLKGSAFPVYIPLQFATREESMIDFINNVIEYKEKNFPYDREGEDLDVFEIVKKEFPNFPLRISDREAYLTNK